MDVTHHKPLFLREGTYDAQALHRFRSTLPGHRETIDVVETQLAELYQVTHPDQLYAEDFSLQCRHYVVEQLATHGELLGDWIYFPWNRTLLHTLSRENNFLLRTNRNRNLITQDEAERLRQATIGVVGLSVGGHIATGLAYGAIGGTFKLADFDTRETTNLNRVRARLLDVGQAKCDIVARQIYELDPYADIHLFPEGLSEKTLELFFASPTPQLIFELIDDFRMKILIRHEARRRRIPVVMLTAVGDNLLLDVERYDQDDTLPLFHGLLGTLPDELLRCDLTPVTRQEYAIRIVGEEYVSERAKSSISAIGKTLVGRPQLAGTVFLNAGISQYIAKTILLGGDLRSGRRVFSLHQLFCS